MENCPYCNSEIEINHDDGYGYIEDEVHTQECWKCSKTFTFSTSTVYYYELEKAPCKNGESHDLQIIHGCPEAFFKYKRRCKYCDEEFVIDQAKHKQSVDDYFDSLINK